MFDSKQRNVQQSKSENDTCSQQSKKSEIQINTKSLTMPESSFKNVGDPLKFNDKQKMKDNEQR